MRKSWWRENRVQRPGRGFSPTLIISRCRVDDCITGFPRGPRGLSRDDASVQTRSHPDPRPGVAWRPALRHAGPADWLPSSETPPGRAGQPHQLSNGFFDGADARQPAGQMIKAWRWAGDLLGTCAGLTPAHAAEGQWRWWVRPLRAPFAGQASTSAAFGCMAGCHHVRGPLRGRARRDAPTLAPRKHTREARPAQIPHTRPTGPQPRCRAVVPCGPYVWPSSSGPSKACRFHMRSSASARAPGRRRWGPRAEKRSAGGARFRDKRRLDLGGRALGGSYGFPRACAENSFLDPSSS